jgi:hypothetical protein
VPRLQQREDQAFSFANFVLSVLTAWALVPLTLSVFWFRYLPSHDMFGLTVIASTLVVSAFSSVIFYQRAKRTLRNSGPTRFAGLIPAVSTAYVLGVVLSAATFWVLWSEDRMQLQIFGYRLYADLRGAELSVRSLEAIGQTREGRLSLLLETTEGAQLRGADLRLADASRAFMVNADLEGADLRRGDFSSANFAGANLTGADLRDANLSVANLTGATLMDADIAGVNLRDVVYGPDPTGRSRHDDLCDLVRTARNWESAELATVNSCLLR